MAVRVGRRRKLPISSNRAVELQRVDANLRDCSVKLEAPAGIEPGMEVLQTGPGRLSC